MKRLKNNFDEWDREADRLQGMGLNPRALKGLDDQSHLYKNLLEDKNTKHISEGLFVTILWASIIALLFIVYFWVAVG
jgi:hypothetical protein|tara:strand:- start:958 stop:1191 length:234 start_codon:yes stop_codon:yes gene_type:complete